MIRSCEICGAEFITRPYLLKSGCGRYCSSVCFGKSRRRVYHVWDRPLTRATAWAMGLMASDGSVSKTNHVSLAVAPKDGALCHQMRAIVDAGAIALYRNGATQELLTWTVGSHHLAAQLRAYGLTETKSRTLPWPDIPADVMADFLRGYWDGDGSLGTMRHSKSGIVYPVMQITSMSLDFMRGLVAYLQEITQSRTRLLKTGRGYYQLFYGGKPAARLAGYLYADAPRECRLERKWKVAATFA